MSPTMVCLSIETQAGNSVALASLFERFGCRIMDRRQGRLLVGFPEASSEREAAAEARLYLSMRPPIPAGLRPGAATLPLY